VKVTILHASVSVSSPKGEFAEEQIQSYQTSLAHMQSVRKYPLGAKFSKGFVAFGKKEL
jgi:hypothetical protein